MSDPLDGYEVIDWAQYGVPADVEVRAYDTGFITFHRGIAHATIDTNDMTREEVVRSIAVALWQIEETLKENVQNRHRRRRALANAGTRH